MYTISATKQFKKDVKTLKRQNRNMDLLKETIERLAKGEALPVSFGNHPLRGSYEGCFDCHLRPDWVLIYEYRGDELILYRTGSHSALF